MSCRLVQLQQTQQQERFPFLEHAAEALGQFVCVLPQFLECAATVRPSLAPTASVVTCTNRREDSSVFEVILCSLYLCIELETEVTRI